MQAETFAVYGGISPQTPYPLTIAPKKSHGK
jgi:hypothetical protein